MKKIIVLIIVLFSSHQLFSNNDSIVKHKLFITSIPSNLLIGDISLGVEYLFKKRFSHEFQAYLKCFNPINIFGKYNQGYRFNYQFKYNFINRKYIRATVNLTTSYLEYSFKNKEDYWYETNPDLSSSSSATYLMDREIKLFGVGLGIGLNIKLSKRFYLGSDMLFELSKGYRSYTVKQNIKPAGNGNYIILLEPYHYSSEKFSNFIFYHPILNIKISFLL